MFSRNRRQCDLTTSLQNLHHIAPNQAPHIYSGQREGEALWSVRHHNTFSVLPCAMICSYMVLFCTNPRRISVFMHIQSTQAITSYGSLPFVLHTRIKIGPFHFLFHAKLTSCITILYPTILYFFSYNNLLCSCFV